MVRLKGNDLGTARAHLRYIQRDGVTREGEPGRLYDAAVDEADGKAFVDRNAGDRHQFRFIVSAEDGAELGVLTESEPSLSPGLIVEVRGRSGAARAVDRTIAAVAAKHAGVYSAAAHHAIDQAASDEHLAAHVRRLEALRRRGLVERTPAGEWTVGQDYLARAARYEAQQRSRAPVGLAVPSWRPLDQLPGAEGATWLDRQLAGASPEPLRAAGFGAEVEAALTVPAGAGGAAWNVKIVQDKHSNPGHGALVALFSRHRRGYGTCRRWRHSETC